MVREPRSQQRGNCDKQLCFKATSARRESAPGRPCTGVGSPATPLPSQLHGGRQLCVLTSCMSGTTAAQQTEVQLQHSDPRTTRVVSVMARDERRKGVSCSPENSVETRVILP